jgi:hypothetical protein
MSKSGCAERNADVPEETFEREVQDKRNCRACSAVSQKGYGPS